MSVGNRVYVELLEATEVPHSILYSQLREQVNYVRMVVVSPLWRGPGNIHGLDLNGQSHRPGWVATS